MPDDSFCIEPVESDDAWQAAKIIRRRVFIEEQGCAPEEEFDAHDATSHHLLGSVDREPVATARWRAVRLEEPPEEGVPAAKLERFAVLPGRRGRGYGRALVRRAVADARQAGFAVWVLHAQAHLEDFYAGLGFERRGPRFEEARIPHVKMVKRE